MVWGPNDLIIEMESGRKNGEIKLLKGKNGSKSVSQSVIYLLNFLNMFRSFFNFIIYEKNIFD